MDAKKNNLMDSINTVFKLAIKVQEDYIKYSPFPELSMNEMHIIEAVSKQQSRGDFLLFVTFSAAVSISRFAAF